MQELVEDYKNKQEIDAGYYAMIEDPQKNTFGIWQSK